jgi:hypothetical protein
MQAQLTGFGADVHRKVHCNPFVMTPHGPSVARSRPAGRYVGGASQLAGQSAAFQRLTTVHNQLPRGRIVRRVGRALPIGFENSWLTNSAVCGIILHIGGLRQWSRCC